MPEQPESNQELITRFDRLVAQRKTVESTWQEIENYVVPFRGKFFREQESEHSIEHDIPMLYDSTAVTAASKLANSIHGSLTSPVVQWFDIHFRLKELNANKEAKAWLQECSTAMFLALQDSDFNVEINESYQDLVSFGTSILTEETMNEEVWEGLDFTSVPLKAGYFELDHHGKVLRFYRMLKWTPLQVYSKFGKDTPQYIKDKLHQVDEKEEIIYCIVPRKGKKVEFGKTAMPKERPFASKYILRKDGESLGKEGGFHEMPAFVTRWLKTSESVFGHSPSTLALPDIKTLNLMKELVLKAGEKVIDPTTMVTERGLMGDLNLEPGGSVVLRSLDDMKPYESGAKFDVSFIQIQQLVDSINAIYHIDDLQLKDSPAMTATEAQIRYELMNRVLGPTVGRIQHDKLNPTLSRTFNIMLRQNQLPEMPQVVVDNVKELDIEYSGPLAQAQRTGRMANVERWLGMVAGLGDIDPTVVDVVDAKEAAREGSLMLNIPQTMVSSKEDVTRKEKDRKKQAKAAEAMAAATAAGDAAQSIGKGMESLDGTTQK